jgi:hydrogenase-4 component F
MLWESLYALWAVPLLAAGVAWFSRRDRTAAYVNLAAATVDLILAGVLLTLTPRTGRVGGDRLWILDGLGVWILFCTALVYFLSSIYAVGYMPRLRTARGRLHRFYGLFALFAGTMFLAPVQNNPGLYWIAIDLTTVVSAFLVGFTRSPEGVEAAWKYIVVVCTGLSLALLGTVVFYWGGTFVLGPVYAMTWSDLTAVAPHVAAPVLLLGFLLVLVGFGTKVGLAPMHSWLPDAHGESPAPVSAMLSGALLNCAMLGIVRYLAVLRDTPLARPAHAALVVLGALSLLVAALLLSRQRAIKRLAAYSSLEHMGVIALGFGFGGVLGVVGALYQMLNHALAKPLVFFGAGNMTHAYGTADIDGVRRVLRFFPRSGLLWLAGAVAITGAPPFGLFLAELTILRGGFAGPNAWAAGLMIVLLIVIFVAFLDKFRAMFFGPEPERAPDRELSVACVLPMVVALLAVLALGLWWPEPLWHHLVGIAHGLGGS